MTMETLVIIQGFIAAMVLVGSVNMLLTGQINSDIDFRRKGNERRRKAKHY